MSLNLASMNSFKGLIYSFEPNPKSFAQLETLVQALDKSAQVSVHNLALSSKSGIGVLSNPSLTHSGYSQIVTDGKFILGEEKYSVDLRTIDDLVSGGDFKVPDFIKLDVEGHEMEVLRGGRETICTSRPIIYFEYNSNQINDTISTLKEMNYKILKLYWMFDEKGNLTLEENPTKPLGQRLVGFVLDETLKDSHFPQGIGITNLLGIHIDRFQEVTSKLFAKSNDREESNSQICTIEILEGENEICNLVSDILNRRFLADLSSLESIIQWGVEYSPNGLRRELSAHCVYAFERLPGLDLEIEGKKSGSKTEAMRYSRDAIPFLREFARNIVRTVR